MKNNRIPGLEQNSPSEVDQNFASDAQRAHGSRSPGKVRWVDDPAFSWHYAMVFVRSKEPLPLLATNFYWINKAYHFLKDGVHDKAIHDANAWWRYEHPLLTTMLKAGLLSPGATIQSVSEALGLPLSSVEAYEQLFFNVIHRRDDFDYISNILYPTGDESTSDQPWQISPAEEKEIIARAKQRHKEGLCPLTQEDVDYFSNTSSDLVLMRAGYFYGIDEAFKCLDFGLVVVENFYHKEKLEALIASDALYFARNLRLANNPFKVRKEKAG